MIPDFNSFVQNTSGDKCCLVYSGHGYDVGSSLGYADCWI